MKTNGNEWTWDARKERAALGFAEGKKWEDIAHESGASIATLSRWRQVPEFQARIDQCLDEMTSEARRILQRNATQAAIKIASLLTYGLPGHTTQLAAAKDILDRVGLKAPEKIEHSGDVSVKVYERTSDFNPDDA